MTCDIRSVMQAEGLFEFRVALLCGHPVIFFVIRSNETAGLGVNVADCIWFRLLVRQ